MKKLLTLCLTAILCLCCLASCGSAHKENTWFSEEKLTNCLVGDLPTVEKDYVNSGDEDIYVYLTDSEFKAYVKSVYDYLCSQEYKYLGTRGEQKNTLAGAFTTYYFKPATELSEFYVGGSYKFVYSDGSLDEDGDLVFCIINIYDYEAKNLEYGTKNFAYNTLITLRYKSEAPLSGFYVLKEVAEGNHFIRNQAGAEWLCEIIADDIAEIKMISGGGGPLPPISFTHISSSRNKSVISSIFEEYYWLDSKPVSEESTQIPDGGYFVVQFILNSGEVKKLHLINGDYYHDGNGNYFEISRLPVFRDGMNFVNKYGFEAIENRFQIHLMDETSVCEIPVSEFEFMELTDDICLDDIAPTYYIEMRGKKISFIRDCYFYINDNRSVYYQLVGKNLDQLIAEYDNVDNDNSDTVKLSNILQRLPYGYNVEGLMEKYDFYDGKYYFVDNSEDYCELLSDIGVPYEGPFDTLFEEKVMLCYLRYVSGSADFIPVEYFYDVNTNKIECKTVYQPEPDVAFPAVEICWCVDLVEVPKNIFEQLREI